MIGLIKLAFEWDLTRVVAYTLSGASSGQSMPSRGVTKAHHTLEHSNDVPGLNTMGNFYAEKFASLLAALKGIDDGGGQTALYNSAVILGMECWSNSSSGHYLTDIPFILAGQGAGKFQTGRIVDAAEAQQQRPADLRAERLRHRLEHLRPREPLQGPDRLNERPSTGGFPYRARRSQADSRRLGGMALFSERGWDEWIAAYAQSHRTP